MLAVRAFNANDMTVGEELVDGKKLAIAIELLFADRQASYLLVYCATDNSYAARVDRFPIPEPLLPQAAQIAVPPFADTAEPILAPA
jgi:hypothetical protein